MVRHPLIPFFVLLVSLAANAAPPVVWKLEPYRDTVAIHATVGGQEGFFAFDTGGGISLLTPQFAAKIGCKPWGRLTGYAMMGNRIDSPRCDDVPVVIGREHLVAPVTGVFDVMSFYSKDAVAVDGLLSLNIFEGKAITIDFPRYTLSIESKSSLRDRVRGATELPVRFTREVQGRALAVSIPVPTSAGAVWFELDSGNSRTILIGKPYAALFGLDPAKEGPQECDFAIAGNIRVRSPRTFVPDMIIDGNIGMPFLKDAVVTIDLASGRLWMRTARP